MAFMASATPPQMMTRGMSFAQLPSTCPQRARGMTGTRRYPRHIGRDSVSRDRSAYDSKPEGKLDSHNTARTHV